MTSRQRVILSPDRLGQLATAGWIALLLPLAAVLLSVVLPPASTWTARAALIGFCVLAVARPDAALLITAALCAYGIILANLAGFPSLRAAEVLVVASIAGSCIRAIPRGSPFRRSLSDSVSVPIVLFAIAAVTSAIVWRRVHQFETGYATAYLLALLKFAYYDYFTNPYDFLDVIPTVVVLEGLALYVIVTALCQRDATFFDRAMRMLAVGGAGIAVLSAVRLAEVALRNPGAITALRASPVGLRISPQIPDYIAAGSYFALCWLVALGIAMAASRRRFLWIGVGVPLVAALYLTGSRSVIVAVLVGLAPLVFIIVRRRAVARSIVAFGVVAVLAMLLGYRWLSGRDFVGETARQSLIIRIELIRAGVRVIQTRPVLGVGLDRFYLVARGLASPELRTRWVGRMNPHNDFLRFAAELGLVGLALFLWILAAAGRRIWRALRTTRDVRLAALAGGLLAFLVTSVFSNPLMVREVSYVFWIALGLAVGHSGTLQTSADVSATPTSAVDPGRSRVSLFRSAIAGLLGSLFVFSVPYRADQELESVNLSEVSYGFYGWGTEADNARSRWSGPYATLFVHRRARVVEIPLRAEPPAGIVQYVEVRIDGRPANRVAVGHEWQRLRILLHPADSRRRRRIDLLVSPTWVPAEVLRGSQDRRVLGVKVGELKVTTESNEGP